MTDLIEFFVHEASEHPMYNINAGLHIYDASGRIICTVSAERLGEVHASLVRAEIVKRLNFSNRPPISHLTGYGLDGHDDPQASMMSQQATKKPATERNRR
jgi:hypothetical protein